MDRGREIFSLYIQGGCCCLFSRSTKICSICGVSVVVCFAGLYVVNSTKVGALSGAQLSQLWVAHNYRHSVVNYVLVWLDGL